MLSSKHNFVLSIVVAKSYIWHLLFMSWMAPLQNTAWPWLIIFLHKYRWRYTDVGNDAGACTCMRLHCLYCASTASSCSHNFLPQMMHRSHSQKQTAGRWPNYAPQTIEPCTCLSSVTPLFRMLCVYLELWLCRIQYQ